MCTNVERSEIEKACKRSTVAAVAEQFGVNENALRRHIASHAPAEASKKVAKPVAVRPKRLRSVAPPEPPRAPSPPPPVEEDEAPITSRSPNRTATARSTLDDILIEIRTLMKSANGKQVPFTDKAAAIRAALQATKLLAGLTGELGATEATVVSSPHFKRMLQVILEAVSGSKHAEARQAIISALEQAERGGGREDVAA